MKFDYCDHIIDISRDLDKSASPEALDVVPIHNTEGDLRGGGVGGGGGGGEGRGGGG